MPRAKLKARSTVTRKKSSKISRWSFLTNTRIRLLLVMVAFGLIGTAALLITNAQTASKAQCTGSCVGIAAASNGNNKYWEVGVDGGVFTFGDAQFHGSLPASGIALSNAIGIATNPAKNGYWIATRNGDVYNFGSVARPAKPSLPSYGVNNVNNIVAIATAPSGTGYYLVGSDGGVFAFDAPFQGSMGGQPLSKPIVGMAVRQQGGYWLVGADGGIFAYGGAPFLGGLSGIPLNKPIVAIESTPSGNGYWLVGADGGIFNYGDAQLYGSLAGTALNGPVNSISRTASGKGYWLSASDGGVFAYGDAQYVGSATVVNPTPPKPNTTQETTSKVPLKQQIVNDARGLVCKPSELEQKDKAGKITACIPNNGGAITDKTNCQLQPSNPACRNTPVAPPTAQPPKTPTAANSRPPAAPAAVPDCRKNPPATPVIKMGASLECVVVLKELLRFSDGGGKRNDYFSLDTLSAVIAFQKSRGLKADGIVGPATWTALRKPAPAAVSVPPRNPTKPISVGLGDQYETFSCSLFKPLSWVPKEVKSAYQCRYKFAKWASEITNANGAKSIEDCSVYRDVQVAFTRDKWDLAGGFTQGVRANLERCDTVIKDNKNFNPLVISSYRLPTP